MTSGSGGNWEDVRRGAAIEQLDADALLRVLLEHEVDFVVIGGLAVVAHGYVRATKDVDIVPRPERENSERLFAAMRLVEAEPIELGDFRPEELPVRFDAQGLAEGGNWALRTVFGRIDVLQWVAGIDSYDTLEARAFAVDVPEVGRVLFASYDDLIAMKESAGREEDLQDIARLREARGL